MRSNTLFLWRADLTDASQYIVVVSRLNGNKEVYTEAGSVCDLPSMRHIQMPALTGRCHHMMLPKWCCYLEQVSWGLHLLVAHNIARTRLAPKHNMFESTTRPWHQIWCKSLRNRMWKLVGARMSNLCSVPVYLDIALGEVMTHVLKFGWAEPVG